MAPREVQRGPVRIVLGSAGLALVSVALLGIALEVFFRTAAPQRSEHDEMFAPHPDLGWTFVPDGRGAIVYRGYAAHYIQTNRDGFRDAPFAEIAPGQRRIAVLGDSFVSNVAVPRAEVFTEILEARLPDVSVMNFGVNGYGPVQMLLLLDEVIESFAPDLVIANLYLRNDFSDVVGGSWGYVFPMPTAELAQDGRAVTILPPQGAVAPQRKRSGGWLEQLHVWHFLRDRLAFLRDRLAGSEEAGPSRFAPPELELLARELRPRVERRYRIVELLLLELDAHARAAGIPIVFTLSPSFAQVMPEVWDEVLRQGGGEASRFDLDRPNRRLLDLAQDHGLAMLDLTPALRAAEQSGTPTYHRVEQHWTPRGNRVVADALEAYLRSELGGFLARTH